VSRSGGIAFYPSALTRATGAVTIGPADGLLITELDRPSKRMMRRSQQAMIDLEKRMHEAEP
jgi:hypothetical protein